MTRLPPNDPLRSALAPDLEGLETSLASQKIAYADALQVAEQESVAQLGISGRPIEQDRRPPAGENAPPPMVGEIDPESILDAVELMGLQGRIKTSSGGTQYLKIHDPDLFAPQGSNPSIEIRFPSPEDAHAGRRRAFMFDTVQGTPPAGERASQFNVAGEPYSDPEVLLDAIGYAFGREARPAARAEIPEAAAADPEQMRLLSGGVPGPAGEQSDEQLGGGAGDDLLRDTDAYYDDEETLSSTLSSNRRRASARRRKESGEEKVVEPAAVKERQTTPRTITPRPVTPHGERGVPVERGERGIPALQHDKQGDPVPSRPEESAPEPPKVDAVEEPTGPRK